MRLIAFGELWSTVDDRVDDRRVALVGGCAGPEADHPGRVLDEESAELEF